LEGLPRDDQACFRELSVQIGFCFLEAKRRRDGMALTDEAMQIIFEVVTINWQEVGPSTGN
jgi:hypothetical protein